ncbi:polymorphic toxin-type HINT domain-containing protein [Kribbella sp. NPDC056345]|uniref:polymorphic toxin-type HINT domain-containing protein n=1 Tax=Kribbella sp. NPDC056345 TaxID=3345789 RepID=UPI0035DBA3DC
MSFPPSTKPPAETKNDRGTTGGDNGGSNGGDGGDNNNSGGWRGALNKHVKKITHNLDRGKNAFLDYQAGIGAGGLDTIKGLLAASQMSFQCFPLLDCSGQANMVKTVVRDPKSLWDAMVAPIKQDWAAGEKTQAAGRVAFVIGEALIGTKGGASLLSTTARNSAAHAGEQAAEGAATAAAKTLCRSFAGATAVLMADGTRRNIKDIKPGDKVLATDPKTGERAAKTVLQVWVHDDTLTDLLVDGGKVTTTEDHPFWSVTDARFEGAGELAPGEKVLSATGQTVRVSGLALRSAHQARAYNLTVADIHTYYVQAGKTSVLVHNQDGPCGVPGVGDTPSKVVNSNMGHVDLTRAERAGFTAIREARDAVRDLGKQIENSGFPEGTIPDTARADRVLVPLGKKGYAAYQIKPNGNAVFKTILERR